MKEKCRRQWSMLTHRLTGQTVCFPHCSGWPQTCSTALAVAESQAGIPEVQLTGLFLCLPLGRDDVTADSWSIRVIWLGRRGLERILPPSAFNRTYPFVGRVLQQEVRCWCPWHTAASHRPLVVYCHWHLLTGMWTLFANFKMAHHLFITVS